MPTKFEKVTFKGVQGDDLDARLDLPMGKPRAYALFAHCFTCTKDIFAAARIAEGLTAHGIAVLRFDFTGLGASEGEFANTNFSSNVGDLGAAADFMREHYAAPKILIGHSLGGAAVLAAAGHVPEAAAVCTIGAPADPAHVEHHLKGDLSKIEKDGIAEVRLVGRPFTVKKQFLDDIRAQNLSEAIGKLGKALLIFHSPVDTVVGIDNAQAIYVAAKHPKSFVSLDDADHLLSKRADAVYAADVIAAWATRYLGEAEEDEGHTPEGTVLVEETGAGKFANRVLVGGRHRMRADEPARVGGDDTGPTPYDFLLAALGTCKSMTMRMYADRKGFPLERAHVTLKHRKIHADDCTDCETKNGMIDEILIAIELDGDLTEEQRQRIFEIADRCPVHHTITHEIRIASSLAE